MPSHVDASALGSMLDLWDIDLARSRVALRDDEPVGIVNLGVRGDEGWIGGLGVVPAERRHGVGRALMESVLEEAPARVTLEVLEQNEPAIRLYEQLGFTRHEDSRGVVADRRACLPRELAPRTGVRSVRPGCRGSEPTSRCRRAASASRSTEPRP